MAIHKAHREILSMQSKVSKQRPSHRCKATASPKIESPNSVLTHHLTKEEDGQHRTQSPQSLCSISGVPERGTLHLTYWFLQFQNTFY